MNNEEKKAKEGFESIITTIRSEFFNHGYITRIFCALAQSNKTVTYDSRVASS
jgi:hypothetical protein